MNYIPKKTDTADRMLAEQAEDTEKFVAQVHLFKAILKQLRFPLGSPSEHFDLDDIDAALNDWLVPTQQPILEWVANDIVAENEFLAGQTRNDARRDLAGE